MFKTFFKREKPTQPIENKTVFLPSELETSEATLPLSHPLIDIFDEPLIHFSADEVLTVRQAFEGVQIFGGTGSGKTSGSGRTLALSMLQAGFGGLVLCAKPDEAETWRRYAEESGRNQDFIFVDGVNDWRFDFLDYEMRAYANTHGEIDNAVDVLLNIIEASRKEQTNVSNDSFWEDSTRELLSNCFTVLLAAYGYARLIDVFRMATSAPEKKSDFGSEKWEKSSFCHASLQRALIDPVRPIPQADREVLLIYFRDIWGGMADKTRSNIMATLSAMSGRFLKGRLREVFCTATNFVPELTHHGAVIVLDMPIKTWGNNGRIAQHIIKYAWQRATERRKPDLDRGKGVPVFLWTDEAQLFLNSYDAEFQGTARSAQAITVNLTQNVDAYKLAMGGRNPDHAVYNLMGNLKTKIFHANDCINTNRYAAEIIGQGVVRRRSESLGKSEGRSKGFNQGRNEGRSVSGGHSMGFNTSHNTSIDPMSGVASHSYSSGRSYNSSANTSTSSGASWGENHGYNQGTNSSKGWSEQKDYIFDPARFRTGLKTGGQASGLIVEGVIVRQGDGMPPYLLARFSQV